MVEKREVVEENLNRGGGEIRAEEGKTERRWKTSIGGKRRRERRRKGRRRRRTIKTRRRRRWKANM